MQLATTPWRPPRPDALVLGVALVAIVALVATNPGGATGDLHRAAVVALAAFVAAIHAWARWDDSQRAPFVAMAPALALAVVLGAAVLQLVPLPRPIVAALAPDTEAIYAAEAAATGAPDAAARPLSIEPIATGRAAVLGLAYLAVFLAARGVGRDPRAPSRVALGLGIVGGLVALGSLAVQAESPAYRGRAAWPFVNPNHLATFLVVALGLALGVAIAPAPSMERGSFAARAVSRRGLGAISALLIVVGVIATQSRAGAAVAALVAFLAASLSGQLRARSLVGAAIVTAVVALAGLAMTQDVGRLTDRFEARPDDLATRLDNWSVALHVAGGHALGGAGLATYDDASLAAVGPDWRTTRPGDAHNDYLELIAGVGWPAGLVACALLLGALAATTARLRALPDPRARAVTGGALAGALGALAHASFDFGLQMPAVALSFSVALGLAMGAVWPDAGASAPGALRAARVGLPLTLAALGALLVVQTSREADASAAGARAWGGDLRPELRAELARRARPTLEAADGLLAAPSVPWERALIEELAGDAGWESAAIEHARRAVAGAPGRAATQAQLGILLLLRTGDAAAEAEGGARLALAGRLGPTVPKILLARGEWALVQLSRTGKPEHAAQAVDLLAQALRRDPSLGPTVKQAIARRSALLGAQGEALRKQLGL